MLMEVRRESGVVRKIAGCDAERTRLAGEAAALSAAAHPGVVRLLRRLGGDPPRELVFEEVRGHPLTELGKPLDWSEIAGLGAAVATTLADLHDIGVVHGSVSEEHILVDEEARPVLCGFGSAKRYRDRSEVRARAAADEASLATLLLRLGPEPPPRSVSRILRSCSNPRRGMRARGCRALARALVEAVPDARLPGSAVQQSPVGRGTRPARHHSKRYRATVVLAGGFIALGLLAAGLFGMRDIGMWAPDHRSAGLCPSVDGGCSDRGVRPGSIISSQEGTFRLIGVSGVAAIGRWRCGRVASPAVLDLATGDVWVFSRWPTDPAGEAAQLVARIPAASGLRVQPGKRHGTECDSLLVERRRLRPAVLDVSGA
jgi:hypothetical protein